MKILLRFSGILLIALIVNLSFGQQKVLNNIYTQNRFIFNPANTGYYKHAVAFLDVKNQWARFQNAPKMRTAGLHAMINESMGLGGLFSSYSEGHFEKFGANLTYSYKVNFTETQSLTFGVSGGVASRQLDESAILVENYDDETLFGSNYNHVGFDAGFGLKYQAGKGFQLDIAAPHLFEDNYDIRKEYLAMASYAFFAKEDKLKIEPSALVRGLPYSDSPIIDGNLIVGWDNKFWLGATYRTTKSIIISGGIRHKNLCLGYAYGYEKMAHGDVKSEFTQGTFEVVLSYHFQKLPEEPKIDFKQEPELTPEQKQLQERLDDLQRELEQLNSITEDGDTYNDGTLVYDPNRLEPGNYVVIYKLDDLSNIQERVKEMRKKDVKGVLVENKTKNQYYIYADKDKNLETAIEKMKEYRKKGFKAWVLMY